MESGQQEDSKPLTEESDRSDSVNDDLGTGRSYECTFCKRGFSTAQALGGHMNIHRRDRARIRHQMSVPSSPIKSDDDASPNSGLFSQFPQQPPYNSPVSESLRNYHAYFSRTWTPTSRLPQAFQTDVPPVQKPHPLSLFGVDLQVGPSTRAAQMKEEKEEEEEEEEEEEAKGQDGEDDELDLELRLGHDL